MAITQQQPLVLASGSAIRARMLKSVGLQFSVVPSQLDESSLKARHKHEFQAMALALAEAKGLAIAGDYPHHLTIAADQVCVCEGALLDKPGSEAMAIEQLMRLQGKAHQQISAVCLTQGDALLWQHVSCATLQMRNLTDTEIAAYVAQDMPLQSCGAYLFESCGKHLFAEVTGDTDTILGLPVTPLLAELHQRGAIAFAA